MEDGGQRSAEKRTGSLLEKHSADLLLPSNNCTKPGYSELFHPTQHIAEIVFPYRHSINLHREFHWSELHTVQINTVSVNKSDLSYAL